PQRRDRRGAETRLVVELAIDGFHHGVRDIKAREIHELEGPHTKARLLPHDRINDMKRGHTFLGGFQTLGVHAAPTVVDDETGHILRAHGGVPHTPGKSHERVAILRVAARTVDHFHHLHERDGVEEVIAHHALRTLATRRDGGDRQRGRVRRQDAVGAYDLLELRKQIHLDIEALDNRLDNQIDTRHFFETGAGCDILQGTGCAFGRHTALFHQLLPDLLQRGSRRLDRLRLHVKQAHLHAGLGGNLGNTAPHGPCPDHADNLDVVHSVSSLISSGERFRYCCSTS